MSGFWPTSPAPKQVQFRSYSSTRVSMPHSFQRQVRTTGAHLWGARLTYTNLLTRAQMAPFWAHAEAQQGTYDSFTWYPTGHTAPQGVGTGTPVARERMNLFPYSEDFTTGAAWAQTDLTQGADTTAPDGGGDAELWYGDGTGSADTHYHARSGGTVANSNVFPCYFKVSDSTRVALNLRDTTDSVSHSAIFAWSAGVLSYSSSSNVDAYGVGAIGSGWYRAWIYWDGTAENGNNLTHYIHPSFTPDGNAVGSYVWGAQLESDHQAEPCAYVATAGTAETGETQSGLTLYTDGWTDSTSDILKAGDFLKMAGHNKVYMVTADADSDANGCATLAIKPAIRTAPADGESLTVNGITFNMALASDITEIPYSNIQRYGLQVDLIEVP